MMNPFDLIKKILFLVVGRISTSLSLSLFLAGPDGQRKPSLLKTKLQQQSLQMGPGMFQTSIYCSTDSFLFCI